MTKHRRQSIQSAKGKPDTLTYGAMIPEVSPALEKLVVNAPEGYAYASAISSMRSAVAADIELVDYGVTDITVPTSNIITQQERLDKFQEHMREQQRRFQAQRLASERRASRLMSVMVAIIIISFLLLLQN